MLNVKQYAEQTDDDYYYIHIPVEWTLHTSGDGYWSNVERAVRIKSISIGVHMDPEEYGSCSDLQVYFYEDDWNCVEDGLIYTDKLFIEQLRTIMQFEFGLDYTIAEDIEYSEQGMQDDDYVSLDAYALADWIRAELLVIA